MLCCDLILLGKFVTLLSLSSFTPFFPLLFLLPFPLLTLFTSTEDTFFSSLGGARAHVINDLLCHQLRPPPTFRTLSKKNIIQTYIFNPKPGAGLNCCISEVKLSKTNYVIFYAFSQTLKPPESLFKNSAELHNLYI